MKSILVAMGLTLSTLLSASDSPPNWGGWKIDAHSVGCDLNNDYWMPEGEKAIHRGILANTKFYGAQMRFSATTVANYAASKNEDLGEIRFLLQFSPGIENIDEHERFRTASIGGLEAELIIFPTNNINLFVLSKEDSLVLLNKIENNEIIDFLLTLETEATIKFQLYPSGNRNGQVWAAMFRTCIKEDALRRQD